MKNNYMPSMKHGCLLTALDDLSDKELHSIYCDCFSWDGSFEECCLYELDELLELLTWDSETIKEFIRIGESDYYYADCYGWHGLDLKESRAHMEFWNADLAEWLSDCLTLEYNYDQSRFETSIDNSAPWEFKNTEELIMAALCDLAYDHGFISLAKDDKRLFDVYLDL